jgi:tryptophan 7-halogenase
VGWRSLAWQIPLQDRYGMGYVFNSSFVSDEKAYEDFEKILKENNYEFNTLKIINFDPGYYEQSWIKNVVAVGLASGFIEPLESTAIHMICNQLRMFCRHFSFIDNNFSKIAYNKKMTNMYTQTFEFVELHYYGSRDDNEFWNTTKDISVRNEVLTELIEKTKHSFITASDIYLNHDRIQGSLIFGLQGYTRVLQGLNILNKQGAQHFLEINNLYNSAQNTYNDLLHNRKQLLQQSRKPAEVFQQIKLKD